MNNISSSNSQKALVPELRFPEFNSQYKKVKLGDISNKISRNDADSNAPIMMISAAYGFINQSEKYSRDNAGQSLKKYTLLKKGEIAYNHGASKLKQFGCCFELDTDEARIPYVYHTFEVKNNYTSYIARLLNNTKIDAQLKRLVSSSVRMDGLLNISYDDYMSIDLYIPTVDEQKKINDFLTLIDAKIEKQRKLVEQLKLYKRGVISALNCTDLEYCEIIVGSVFNITRGNVLATGNISPVKTEKYCYPVYSSQTKNDGLLGYYSDYLYEDAITWTTDGANAGYTKFRKGKFYCTNVCGVLINNDGYANNYVAELINAISKKYVSYVGNPKLMNNVMAEVKIALPNIENQEIFSRIISLIDSKISNECSILNYLLMIKSALLQKMFI